MDQDGIAAKRVVFGDDQEVFAKTEANGDVVVGLFNLGDEPQNISVAASVIGLPEDKDGYSLKNLWSGKASRATGRIDATVAPHGVVLYRITR